MRGALGAGSGGGAASVLVFSGMAWRARFPDAVETGRCRGGSHWSALLQGGGLMAGFWRRR
jgi:hypothetical protein